MKKIQITIKQAQQFNRMRHALITINKNYMTPDQIRKHKDCEFLGFDEMISMSYENIQGTAAQGVRGVRAINIPTPPVEPKTDMLNHGAY